MFDTRFSPKTPKCTFLCRKLWLSNKEFSPTDGVCCGKRRENIGEKVAFTQPPHIGTLSVFSQMMSLDLITDETNVIISFNIKTMA